MTTKPRKVTLQAPHVDILGRELAEGDFVAASNSKTMVVAKIIRLTPKMLKLSRLNSTFKKEFTRYPYECVLLPRDDVTFHIIKTSH